VLLVLKENKAREYDTTGFYGGLLMTSRGTFLASSLIDLAPLLEPI
jgi:hypothetical protein